MTTFATGNPIGSTDARDLYDNAENFDRAVNQMTPRWTDRFGVSRRSWVGMAAYVDLGDYAADLLITGYNEIFRHDSEFYRAGVNTVLPYTTSGSWSEDGPFFVPIGDAALRQDIVETADMTIGYYRNAVNCNQFGGLSAAVADSDTLGKIIVVTDTQNITENTTVTGRVLCIEYGLGLVNIASGKTLTINSPFQAGAYQVFAGTGTVTGLKEARPEWFGSGTTADDSPAITTAIAAAQIVKFAPNTTYNLGSMIDEGLANAKRSLIGGPNTVFKRNSSFTGTCMVSLGNRLLGRANAVWRVELKGINFDVNGGTIPAIETYGLLGNSSISNVLITNFAGTAVRTYPSGFRSDETGYLAAPLQNINMNESLIFDHVIAQSDLAITGGVAIFELDSCFETSLYDCRAFGRTVVDSEVVGLRIGHNFSSWGVKMFGCTANNFKNSNAAIKSYGIHYSNYARDCHDWGTNFEAITGSAVLFKGLTYSGTKYPSGCSSITPRLYNNNNADELNPAILFYDSASFCGAKDIAGYNSTKTWVSFDASDPANKPSGCSVTGVLTSKAIADIDDIIQITANGIDSGNSVSGFSTVDKRNFVLNDDIATASGVTGGISFGTASIYTDGNYTNIRLDATDKLRVRKNDGTVIADFNVTGAGRFTFGAGLFLPNYANNAAALAGGLVAGQLYRTAGDPDTVCIVH